VRITIPCEIYRGAVYDTSLTGWIVFDKPPSASAKLTNPLKNCNYVALDGEAAATVPVFRYFDPVTGNQLNIANEVRSVWSSDPYSVIPFPELRDPVTYDPPLEDVTYTFRVNSAACSSQSSFFYESIHVKADFTAEPVKGGAPLEVTFTDKSVRGTKKYSWDFGDRNRQGKKLPEWVVTKDSLWVFDNPFTHKYYFPGEYSVRLTIESEFGCIDSMRLDTKIEVEKSKLHIPNVFTPDGDGLNDYFTLEAISLRFIEVNIFSRSGVRVYSFFGEGEKLKDWPGWDGTVINSPTKASPGVYFYIIRAAGWDDIEYDSKEYRGFVYLYR
jgi:gliding motility-associated-like protein